MFCENCGRQLADGVKFCPGCGTAISEKETVNPAQQSNGETYLPEGNGQAAGTEINVGQPVVTPPVYGYTKPKKSKKPFIFLGVGIAVLIVAAAMVMLLISAINPISQTFMAVAKLKDMSGANISVDTNVGGSRMSADMAFEFGKDLESSVLDATVGVYGEKVRIVYSDGDLGGEADGTYIFFSDVIDMLQDAVDELLEEADMDIDIDVNNLVKDGGINESYIRELYENADIEALYNDDYDEDIAEGMTKLFTDFIIRECGKKDVQEKFLSGYKKSGNTYEYTVDMAGAALAFIEYLENCENSRNKNVSEAAELMLDNLYIYDDAKAELEDHKGEVTVDVKYSTAGGRLCDLDLEFDVEDEGRFGFSLSIENYNKPDINMDDIQDFLEEADENSFSFGW